MACPHFEPVQPRTRFAAADTAMLPLGELWEGVCRCAAGPAWTPDESTLGRCCNLGYARGNCSRFPVDAGPDAVRFAIADDDGVCIRVRYAIERDHLPVAHGTLRFSSGGASQSADAGEIPGRQARAYVASYLRRKPEASGSSAASGES